MSALQLRQVSLRKKLIGLVLLGIVAISGLFTFELLSLSRVASGTVQDLLGETDKVVQIGEISIDLKSEVQAWKDTLIRGKDPAKFAKYSHEMDAFAEEIQKDVAKLKELLKIKENSALADEFLRSQIELTQAYVKARQEFLKPENYDIAGADAAVRGKDRPVLDSLKSLNDRLFEQMRAAGTARVQKALHETLMTALIVCSIVSFLILVLNWGFVSRIVTSINAVAERLSQAVEKVGAGGTQLASASQSLSAGATEGAASIEETVASLEEVSSMVKLNADHASEAAALSQKSSESASYGQAEMQKLVQAISEVSKGAKKVEEIIAVIDDIAFQTNLLALNAAVEAARAGEQGKGFAVVAEAVRNLAQRSASAAKDIQNVILDNVSKTEAVAKIADQNGAALTGIVTSVKKVADLNSEIASASQQQSNGVAEISKAMNQMDTVMQSNAASAEEAAASSEELSNQSSILEEIVRELNCVVTGKCPEAQAREGSGPAETQYTQYNDTPAPSRFAA